MLITSFALLACCVGILLEGDSLSRLEVILLCAITLTFAAFPSVLPIAIAVVLSCVYAIADLRVRSINALSLVAFAAALLAAQYGTPLFAAHVQLAGIIGVVVAALYAISLRYPPVMAFGDWCGVVVLVLAFGYEGLIGVAVGTAVAAFARLERAPLLGLWCLGSTVALPAYSWYMR